MRLRQEILEQEPVVFDRSRITIDTKREGDNLPALFAFGHASFGDDLLDAVALCNGIDEQGRLDPDILSAAQKTSDYLADKQGQPLMLLETITDPESKPTREGFNYIAGYIAVVANVERPVGMSGNRLSRVGRAGIAVIGGYNDLNGYFENDGKYRSQYLTDVDREHIRFADHALVLGKPGAAQSVSGVMTEEREYYQHIIAGTDVVSWIKESFSDHNAYRFYSDVVFSLLRHGRDVQVLDTVLDEEFTVQAQTDLDALKAVELTIAKYEKEAELLKRIQQGKEAEASLALMQIEESYEGRADQIPRTAGSYPLKVTAGLSEVGDGLEARHRAIEFHSRHLSRLTLRAAQVAG